jgi:hypothetical protein
MSCKPNRPVSENTKAACLRYLPEFHSNRESWCHRPKLQRFRVLVKKMTAFRSARAFNILKISVDGSGTP